MPKGEMSTADNVKKFLESVLSDGELLKRLERVNRKLSIPYT